MGEYEGVWEQSCVNVEGRRRCVGGGALCGVCK